MTGLAALASSHDLDDDVLKRNTRDAIALFQQMLATVAHPLATHLPSNGGFLYIIRLALSHRYHRCCGGLMVES